MKFKEINSSDIISIHGIIAKSFNLPKGRKNKGLIDSILVKIDYLEYNNMYDRVALLLEGIIRLHPFIDGNKRTALASAAVYLSMNGYSLICPLSSVAFIYKIANTKDNTPDSNELLIKEIANWLQNFSFPVNITFIDRIKIKYVLLIHYQFPIFLVRVFLKIKLTTMSKFILKTYLKKTIKKVNYEFITNVLEIKSRL